MQNITAHQKATLDQLRESGLVTHYWSDELGVIWHARGEFGGVGSEPAAAIQTFLSKWGILFGPPEISSSLQFIRTRTDSIEWRHLEFQQTFGFGSQPTVSAGNPRKRLEVVGGYMSFHINQANELVEVQSSCWRDVSVRTGGPTIDENRARLLLASPSHVRPTGRGTLASIGAKQVPGKLVVLPYEGDFRLAWKVEGMVTGKQRPEDSFYTSLPGANFIDAHTGNVLWSVLHGAAAEIPDNGNGMSNLPFGGPYNNRSLNIVRIDATRTYRLRDTTHSRDIVTFDWGGADPDYFDTAQRITAGSVPLSSDTDGDKNWSNVAADTSIGALTRSQQTEVDAHYETGRVYEWYDTIAGPGGREGFDDNNYGSNVPANMPVYNLAHVNIGNAQFYSMNNDAFKRVSYLSFGDRTSDDGIRAWAASPFVVCHEYHHGITEHSVGSSIPDYPTTMRGWSRALSEGLADAFGGIYSKAWYAGREISETGTMMRNLAFPRDPDDTSLGKDHWADRDTDGGNPYPRGQILGHCAYLLDQGGVHQRSGRTPDLIPVHPLGTEELGGVQVSVSARIWYRMMSTRFAAVEPYNSETSFQKIRTECVASAIDLYGSGSDQHRAVVQAFYAVGLHPSGETYGADVTALQWGASWRFSVPYLGISTPSWSSVDLFINNGGTSEWNAVINVEGSDELVENSVYCRVRNIGDQSASNINVTFEYAKHGTAPVVWTAMEDAEGNIQTLNIPSLAAGDSNFSMEEQNTPPDTARVRWSVPAHALGEEVGHYCIRASITASNDVNPQNKDVQSNVAYFMMAKMKMHSMGFHIGNPKRKPIRARLRITHSLPEGWEVTIRENIDNVLLQPLTEQIVHLDVKRPEGTSLDDDTRCSPPYDGEIRGNVWGCISGPVSGTLMKTTTDASRIQGHVAVKVSGSCTLIVGSFKGRLDCEKGKLTGTIKGSHACGGSMKTVCIPFEGSIRPIRRIEIEQLNDDEILGGVSFQLQLP